MTNHVVTNDRRCIKSKQARGEREMRENKRDQAEGKDSKRKSQQEEEKRVRENTIERRIG